MNIWSRLGISVALVAVFCIAAAELLQPSLFYQHHKWPLCIGLVVLGALLLVAGTCLNRRIHARYLQTQAALAEQDRDTEPKQWEPFLLFNLAYWGVIIAIFGCIIVFLVPTHNKRQKAPVVARAPAPSPPKPKPPPPPPPKTIVVATNPPLQIPRFHLQGVTIREPASALINGRTYFLGEEVNQAIVIFIDTNVVLLNWRGINIPLHPPQ